LLLAPISGDYYLRAHMGSDTGMGFLNRIVIAVTRFVAKLLFAVVDAAWFRALCRPVVRLLRFRKAVSLQVDGHTMFAFGIDQVALLLLYKFKANEYFEQILLSRVVKPGMTAVDVGANLGYFTLTLARQVGPGGAVYAFEPEAANVELLRNTIAANNCEQVRLEAAAVSESDGICRLYLCEENAGDNRIFDSGDGRPFREVKTVALDSFLPDTSVDLVKMDIQGAEARALRGMKKLLTRSRDVVVMSEFSPSLIRRSGSDPAGYLDDLQALGFDLYFINSSQHLLQRVDRQKLLELPANHKDVNLLFVRTMPTELAALVSPTPARL
jgi:FkbM family methyltransferase